MLAASNIFNTRPPHSCFLQIHFPETVQMGKIPEGRDTKHMATLHNIEYPAVPPEFPSHLQLCGPPSPLPGPCDAHRARPLRRPQRSPHSSLTRTRTRDKYMPWYTVQSAHDPRLLTTGRGLKQHKALEQRHAQSIFNPTPNNSQLLREG